jgi:hypothetical protein
MACFFGVLFLLGLLLVQILIAYICCRPLCVMLLLLSCSSYSSDLIVGIWLQARREIINVFSRFVSCQFHKSWFILCRPVATLIMSTAFLGCICEASNLQNNVAKTTVLCELFRHKSTFLSAGVLFFGTLFTLLEFSL